VVQILGGVGNPAAEVHAAHITGRLANLVKGDAIYLPAPGVAGSEQARDVLLQDQYVQEAVDLFDYVTLALVGIGAVEPSRLLASSGNVFSPQEIESLRRLGAVGDVCLRFFSALGVPVATPLDCRVIGMTLDQLRRVRRSVGIAGGERKLPAIRGALEGGLINVLITDHEVASRLTEQ
jgi:DNA-binding transcriptional regulator LsrR (DeoR family)